jgi:hypothetical protein
VEKRYLTPFLGFEMENAMKRSLVVFSLMAMSSLAFAEGFNYTYVQASYGTIDADDPVFVDDGDGLGLNGSFGITDNLNIVGSYQTIDFDAFGDADQWSIGLGVHTPITEMMDVVADVSYLKIDGDVLGIPFDDDGFGLTVGVRANVTSLIEVNAGISYVDLDSGGDDTGFGAGVLFNVTDMIALGLAGSWDGDVSVYSLSGRVYFGN